MTKPVILFRLSYEHEDEYEIAKKHFDVKLVRTDLPSFTTVVGRYSVLPFYSELEEDLENLGCRLINSYLQHAWIRDFYWYEDLKDVTPESWFEHELPQHWSDIDFPLVVKGATNSRKHQWDTHMFAEDRTAALEVASKLANDPLIGPQGLIYRRYVPLKLIEKSPINGALYVNEWRFFFYKERLLSHGFYWTNCQYPERAMMDTEGMNFTMDVAKRVAPHVNFFVLDVAEKADGGWLLVEVNDGQMSGLSMNDPDVLYGNLADALADDNS